MITRDVRSLLSKANSFVARGLEGAAGFSVARTHYEVTLEHLLLKTLEEGTGDLLLVLRHFEVDPGALEARLLSTVEGFRIGNSGRPVFSPLLLDTLERAYLSGSLEYGQELIRSSTILAAALDGQGGAALRPYLDLLERVRTDELRRDFASIVQGSIENQPTLRRPGAAPSGPDGTARPAGGGALAQFTIDFTAAARDNRIDPVFGRDEEIRQMIDILSRRRKNNPILVGEAGVGKTALVEGLALRIAEGDVPDVLREVEIRSLDMGLLQAGAGVKGEFENRLKTVIDEIKASPVPIVTFIDEAHTLIGAGGPAGGSDAANLLKPALARGELRTVAATTWSEYKKYFEKDAALARRFQLVKVDEPDEGRATAMLRGLKPKFEEVHHVRILDSSVVAAVQLSQRYISGRQLPDKAVDLMDTAGARVKIAQTAKPAVIDDRERRLQNLEIALAAVRRDLDGGTAVDPLDIASLEEDIASTRARLEELNARWETEKEAVARVEELRGGADPEGFSAALLHLGTVQASDPMIPLEVTPDVVASVVSDWTGIPAGRMMRDQANAVLALETSLNERVLGQDHALATIAGRIKGARSGLGHPDHPQGVFLLVGPSGVGKTETGIALADTLFGGKRFLVTVNMSEYMEAHTVSRLIGSPPGYVGYGEGGVLTEAVRQRPYSVVLLDEVEKSHPDVMNLFYQVFDKGVLADGEGREIDFRNTVLMMTSNLASEAIAELCGGEVVPESEELLEAIRPQLRERFKPALLARMTIVPFFPIGPDVMRRIVDLKMRTVAERLAINARITLNAGSEVADWIAARCTSEETGARNVDAVIQGLVLPMVSHEILTRMATGQPTRTITIGVGGEGELTYCYD